MTYRIGAYVMDTRENRIAQVIGQTESRVQLQAPDRSLQWEAPATALRLATREERNAAGLRPYLGGCAECVALEDAHRNAAAEDRPRVTAEARTHWIVAHAVAEARR
ncbi:hypothetical protein [Streptomyces sp. NPDC053048]|uniref:hypothetical protein n=1 Tax=Streptomyces sp. NPDC053048 TaxID=3365694 RepID=UPI0037D3A503